MNKQKRFLSRFELNRIINISISTSKIKKLIIQKQERRPQLHTIIYGLIGTAKSTILYKIGEGIKSVPIVSLSKATIYGTLDKNTGILNPPAIWNCRNSCLLIDEFSFNTQSHQDLDVINSLLPVLEYPYIKKQLGFRVNDVNITDNDLYLRAKDGKLECKTRFVFIATSMSDVSTLTSSSNRALLSRCLPIPHYPSYDELFKFSGGELNFFEYKPYKVNEEIKIGDKDYNYLREFTKANVEKPEQFLRTLGDLCRIFAVIRKHDEEFYKLVCGLRV